jgi:hypothetical protein
MELIYFLTLRAWWASKRRDGLRRNIGRKVKSAWRKVKAVKLFQSQGAILNKQRDEDIIAKEGEEKDDDKPPLIYKLHVEQVIVGNSREEEGSGIASPRNCSPTTPKPSLKVWEKELGKPGGINIIKKSDVSAARYNSILGHI